MGKSWIDNDLSTLRRMFNDGASDVEIANALGTTRNAVIGRRNKMGMKRSGRAQRPRKPKAPVDDDKPVGLLALQWFHCRSVVEMSGPDGYPVYCGRRRTVKPNCQVELSSYCKGHHRIYHAYNPHNPLEDTWRKQQRPSPTITTA